MTTPSVRQSIPIILLSAVLVPVGSVMAEPQLERAALPDYLAEEGVTSGTGWAAAGIQVDEQRYLVVQHNGSGEIYQLTDFDGAFVCDLRWRNDAMLQVGWQSPDGHTWLSLVQFDTAGDAEQIEVMYTRGRGTICWERSDSGAPYMDMGTTYAGAPWPPDRFMPTAMRPYVDR